MTPSQLYERWLWKWGQREKAIAHRLERLWADGLEIGRAA
jgi:hypothetical protein